MNISSRIPEYFITGLLGALPTRVGDLLRASVYNFCFSEVGISARIKPRVRFFQASCVSIDEGVYIGPNSEIYSGGNPIRIMEDARIEAGVSIRGYGEVKRSQGITIGENTTIGLYVCIGGPGVVTIGKHCLIASHCSMYANNHIFSDPTKIIDSQGVTTLGITIEDDCWLGSGVRVMDGVTIGRGSVVGAGAVVTHNIPPNSIAVGVPAKVIRQRQESPIHNLI